jgi:hypothetical protein
MRIHAMSVASAALLLSMLGACTDTSVRVGLHTRSATYAHSVLERDSEIRSIMTSTPPKVGVLQGISPGAPVRGLGAFASDAVRVGLHRACPESTVLSGPTTLALASAAGKSAKLSKMLSDAKNTGILAADDLAEVGRATGLDYFFLATIAQIDVRGDSRFAFLGTTIVRSGWTTANLVLQLWHAPSGKLVWQSVGDCTGYSESGSASPVSIHDIASDLVRVMIRDLLDGRSRTTLLFREEEHPPTAPGDGTEPSDDHGKPTERGEWVPADKPDYEPEPKAVAPTTGATKGGG